MSVVNLPGTQVFQGSRRTKNHPCHLEVTVDIHWWSCGLIFFFLRVSSGVVLRVDWLRIHFVYKSPPPDQETPGPKPL
jgi:hypothetical protein